MNETSRGSRGGRRRALILAAAVAGIAVLAACGGGSSSSPGTQASAHVYWASNNMIGRANLNGTGASPRFISVRRARMIAVTSRYIYWASNNNTIGRANLNGTGASPRFIAGASGPVIQPFKASSRSRLPRPCR